MLQYYVLLNVAGIPKSASNSLSLVQVVSFVWKIDVVVHIYLFLLLYVVSFRVLAAKSDGFASPTKMHEKAPNLGALCSVEYKS